MKPLVLLLLPIISLSAIIGTSAAEVKTARLQAFCDSITADPNERHIAGVGDAVTYYTTWDGNPNTVSHYDSVNGGFRYSGEIEPTGINSRTYVADYVISAKSSPTTILQHGSVQFQIDFEDANANGINDLIEPELGVSKTFPVTSWAAFPQPFLAYGTVVFQRAAGSDTGWCTVIYPDYGQSASTSWHANHIQGSVKYSRVPNQIIFSEMALYLGGTTNSVTGQTSFTCPSKSILKLDSCNLTINGKPVFMSVADLRLTNGCFRGTLKLSDGWTFTSQPDYVDWHLEIEDPNDADNNGIPDITDSQFITPARITRITKTGATGLLEISNDTPCTLAVEFSQDMKLWRVDHTIDAGVGQLTTKVSMPFDSAFYRLRSISRY